MKKELPLRANNDIVTLIIFIFDASVLYVMNIRFVVLCMFSITKGLEEKQEIARMTNEKCCSGDVNVLIDTIVFKE